VVGAGFRRLGIVAIAATALLVWVALPADGARIAKKCASEATQTGTGEADILVGDDNPDTAHYGKEVKRPDRLEGLGGGDSLKGLECNDKLLGGEGADELTGGNGHDVLRGGIKSDRLFGADGSDRLYGDGSKATGGSCPGGECDADFMSGGDGNDVMVGKFGHDTFYGGKGFDKCLGDAKDTYLAGCEVRGGKRKKRRTRRPLTPSPPPVATATTVNLAVNDNKDLVHVWGTTTPHQGSDTVYLVVQHKGASGDWGRVKWGCFGFGADDRFQHTFALSPADNYRVEARYGDSECPPVAYQPSSSGAVYFNVK
jgi:Ca2+-binding RTX toxin-like protein